MMKESKKQSAECVNCGTELVGKFCHKCGEKKVGRSDFALSNFVKEVFEKFTHLDSKLLRSLWLLVSRPGFLTVEYLRGRRKPYMKPLSLFFIINLLYFLTIGFNTLRTYESPLHVQLLNHYSPVVQQMLDARFPTDKAAEMQAFEVRFDHQNHVLAKFLLLLMVPMMAATLWLLYGGQGFYFGEHLVTALHFQAVLLLLNMVLGIFMYGSVCSLFLNNTSFVAQFMLETGEPLLWVALFAFFTLKSVYRESHLSTILKTVLWTVAWLPTLILYRFLVFLATFYTI